MLGDVLDSVSDAVAVLEAGPVASSELALLYYNRAFSELTGFTAGEALGQPSRLLAGEETDPDERARFRQCAETGQTYRGDLVVYGAGGRRLLVEVKGNPLLGADGQQRHYVAVLRDVAVQRKAEEAQRREAERHALALKATGDVVWEWDVVARVKTWSGNLERVFGYRPEESQGREWWFERVHPDDREALLRTIEGMASIECETVRGEYRFRRADGTWANVLDKVCVIRNAKGEVVRLVGAMHDLTDHMRAEARLARLIDQSRDLVAEVDLAGKIVAVSGSPEKLLGYRAGELQGRFWQDFVHPDDVWLNDPEFSGAFFTEGRPVSDRFSRLRSRDGAWMPFVFTAMWQPEDATILAVGRDVSAAHEAQERLRESEERYRTLFRQSPIAQILHDRQTLQVLDVNEAACRLYGYSEKEFKQLTMLDIRPEEDRARLRDFFEREFVFGESSLWVHLNKEGTPLNVEVTAHSMMLDGRPVRLAQVVDVTERHQMEERLRQAQKMEAVGQLAGGIAHDFNNILTVINGFAERLQGKVGGERVALEHILEAGRRAAGLTRQLLAFSRKQVMQTCPVDLNQLVLGLQPILRRLVRENIEIDCHLSEEECVVNGDYSQLEQVVLNLAINAGDAMGGGGRLRIDTRRVTLDSATAKQTCDLLPGEYVAIEVSDSGHGIEPAHLPRLFEPFFTTKEKGRGTGLGLPTVYGIVKQGGGGVTVSTEVGVGSMFRVLLPFCSARVQVAKPVRAGTVGKGQGTILVVEDDPAVRGLMVATLEDCGYHVLAAADGVEAIELSQRERRGIDLLVTDVVMPGMGGGTVAERLVALRPQIKVLFVSGYAEDALVQQGVSNGGHFLAKPFTPFGLEEKIRSILTPSAAGRSILLVDDEAPVRQLFRAVLEEAGYLVREAPEGKTALKMLEQEAASLLITDLVMPEREGIETIMDVRQRYPATRIISVSGAFEGRYLQMAKLLGAQQVLQKPVTAPELLAAVREVLASNC